MTVSEIKIWLENFDDNDQLWIDTQGAYYQIKSIRVFDDEETSKKQPCICCDTINPCMFGI